MAGAEVGDDVYGEDPSINRLQEMAAEIMGKQAALFMPSGTMANQAALRALSSPGDLVLAGSNAHILLYEAGAAAALSGVQIRTIGTGGFFDADDVAAAIGPDDVHLAPATVLAAENTHNASGGRVFPLHQLEKAVEAARSKGLKLHLDGARIFNAACGSGSTPARLAAPFDTVSFCLSKGLGCPVGSMLCGDVGTIKKVHRFRKMLGGGMRQAGILAAAGIHALEHHVDRLTEDHATAAKLAAGLAEIGLVVQSAPETNMVVFAVNEVTSFIRQCGKRGVLLGALDSRRIRAVTHLDVSASDIDQALEHMSAVLSP